MLAQKGRFASVALAPLLFLICLFITLYHIGYDLTLSWRVTAEAQSEEFVAYQFRQGPFSLELPGEKYKVIEKFSAGPITHHSGLSHFLMSLIWLGVCYILAVSTFLKRYWFLAIGAGFILMSMRLELDQLGIASYVVRSRWLTGIFILSFLTPAYYFHAFREQTKITIRLLTFALISSFWAFYMFSIDPNTAIYFISRTHYSVICLVLVFLFLVAEEIVFGILFLITRATGSKDNEKHFLFFGLFYIGFITVYYLKKAGFISTAFDIMDPFLLLAVSGLIAWWSFKHKQSFLDQISNIQIDIRHVLMALSTVAFGYFSLGFARGNDPAYEAFHYLILYFHLGFGFMFFAYIIVNFVSPMASGLQVYKVAYKEQNFPYISAKLGGFAAVAAFFFLSNKEPLELIISSKYNYQGDAFRASDEELLAQQSYLTASMYGYNTHYANYQLAIAALKKNDLREAHYRYGKATKRYPSAYAWVNRAETLVNKEDEVLSITLLREGLMDFPENGEIQNNLAVGLYEIGGIEEAKTLLSTTPATENWNQASTVNKWGVRDDIPKIGVIQEYENGSIPIRANIISLTLNDSSTYDLPLEPTLFNQPATLHHVAYLINAGWYFADPISIDYFRNYAGQVLNVGFRKNLMAAGILNAYKSNRVELAFRTLDDLQGSASNREKGLYLNTMGKFALDQGSPKLALNYFDQAILYGNPEAAFNLGIAFMEDRQWSKARGQFESLAKIDSSLLPMINSLSQVWSSDIYQKTPPWVYYRWDELKPEEIAASLKQMDARLIISLWEKIFREYAQRNDETLHQYFEIFRPFLNENQRMDFEAFWTITSGKDGIFTENNNSYFKHLWESEDSVILKQINPFEEWFVLEVINQKKLGDKQVYDLLLKTTEVNSYGVPLIKAYALKALELGLSNYAEQGLLNLYDKVPRSEYYDFEGQFEEKRREISTSSNW
ncbi:MAG: tetratricopeptide repeat protein [Cyclobacteriaceae bacterium]|nr:tetratricopeptide repeat protein [Cyclobacteriaceae bacterium HetDA_MAG_MS6]